MQERGVRNLPVHDNCVNTVGTCVLCGLKVTVRQWSRNKYRQSKIKALRGPIHDICLGD